MGGMVTTDLGPERRERIVQRVRDRGTVRISALAAELEVSLMTVRRDIATLAEEGRLERIHGGARLRGGHVADEPLPSVKGLLSPTAKRAIARLAADQIQPGEVIGIGSGTTTLIFAEYVARTPGLTVATNSVPVAQRLWELGSARVILTGGEATPSQALAGPIAIQSLQPLHFDTVVLGTHGFDLEAGCTTPNLLEAQMNEALLARARRSVVLADAEKWGVVALTTFAGLADLDVLVSDSGLSQHARTALADAEVGLLVAEVGD